MPQVGAFVAGAFGATAPAIGTAAFGAYAAGAAAATWLTTSFAGQLLTSVALSALSQALAPRPEAPGIRTENTQTGGTNPEAFVIGRYATEGTLIAPPMSHSRPGGDRNNYLNYVIELSSAPGCALDSLIIDGNPVELGTVPHADYGLPLLGDYQDRAWVRYHDGSQTAADAMLLAKYPAPLDRPWSADMVGGGICYAIMTFLFDRELFSGFPAVRFVLDGIPLYDPRADSSVGGDGAQRWADPATWAVSHNTAVQIYNVMRGIALPGGDRWGGDAQADDLPLSNWFAAMNACDLATDLEGGGAEPQFRSAYEIRVDDEPAKVVEELLKGCSGQVAEVGGVWKIRVGGPGLPVFYFSDDDVIADDPREFDPFPSITDTYNGIHASYPEPDSLWQSRDAPPRYNSEYEADDGGRRLVADLSLPAVPYADQVQRIMRAYIEEERRFRRHQISLPGDAIPLEPLDSVAWSSERNGYLAKIFEISSHVDPLITSRPRVSLRERDPDDYDWQPGFTLPSSPTAPGWSLPAPQAVAGFNAVAVAITDADANARRPAIYLTWDDDLADTTSGIRWEIRLTATAQVVLRGSTQDVGGGGYVVSDGILPATGYDVRARLVQALPSQWTDWISVATPDVRLGAADLAQSIMDDITAARVGAQAAAQRAEEVLDAADANVGDLRNDVTSAIGSLTQAMPLADRIGVLDADMAARVADIQRIDRDLDLRLPREIETAQTLHTVQETLLRTMLELSDTSSRMSDAGIIVDPDSGRVTIEAVSRLDDQFGLIRQTLDAAQAEITTRITYTDAANLIAQAQLGPENMPILDDYSYRLTDIEQTVSALDGAIEDRISTVIVDGIAVTVTDAVDRIDTLEGEMTQRITTTQFDALTSRVTDAETTMSTFDGARFGIALSDISAQAQSIEDQNIQTLGQLLDAYESREALRVDLAYLRQDMVARVDEAAGESVAQMRTEMGVAYGDAISLIEAERTTRASDIAAMAEDIVAMEVRVDDTEVGLTEVNRIEADSASASARALHQVQLDLSGPGGAVSAISALDARIEETEAGLVLGANDRRQLSAGIAASDYEAAVAQLRGLLLDQDARAQYRLGLADAREDFYVRVREGEEAIAGEIQELTAGLGNALSLITAERYARASAVDAEAADRLAMRVDMEDVAAGARQELRVWVDGESAVAERTNDLEAAINGEGETPGISARLSTVETAIVHPTNGLAARVDGLEVDIDGDGQTAGIRARLGTAEAAIGDAEAGTGLAGQVRVIETTVNDPDTGVEATATALDTLITSIGPEGETLAADIKTLSVSDGTNLIAGGQLTDPRLWNIYQGWQLIAPAVIDGIRSPGILRYAAPVGVSGWGQSVQSRVFAATKGGRYDVSFQARRSGPGTVTLRCAIAWMDELGAQVGYDVVAEPTITDADVHDYALTLTAPAGTDSAQLRVLVNTDTSTVGCDIAAPMVERENTSSARARGRIDQIYALSMDDTSVFGSWINSITAEFGDLTSFVSNTATAYAGVNGASSTWVLRQAAGEATGVVEAVAFDNPTGPPITSFSINYDYINLNGRVTAEDLDIASLAVAGFGVFGGQVQSANYVSGVSGWRITQAGAIEADSLTVRTGMLASNAVSIDGFAGRNDQIAGAGYSDPADPWLTYMQIDVDLAHEAQAAIIDAVVVMTGLNTPDLTTKWSFRLVRTDTGGVLHSQGGDARQQSLYLRGLTYAVPAGVRSFLLQYRLGTGLGIQNCSMTASVKYR